LIASQLIEVALLVTQLGQASLLFEQALALRENILAPLPFLSITQLALFLFLPPVTIVAPVVVAVAIDSTIVVAVTIDSTIIVAVAITIRLALPQLLLLLATQLLLLLALDLLLTLLLPALFTLL
jgi:hypothetical protein